jgi:hypothetical protein
LQIITCTASGPLATSDMPRSSTPLLPPFLGLISHSSPHKRHTPYESLLTYSSLSIGRVWTPPDTIPPRTPRNPLSFFFNSLSKLPFPDSRHSHQ